MIQPPIDPAVAERGLIVISGIDGTRECVKDPSTVCKLLVSIQIR